MDPFDDVDALNRRLRPLAIYCLCGLAVLFLGCLGAIMLFRYGAYGEISWEGLSAFIVAVVGPVVHHFQNRHALYKYGRLGPAQPSPSGGLVNQAALS